MPADAQGACAPETSGQPPCVQSMQLHRRKDVAATNSPRTTMTLVGGRTMENSCETGPTGREADLSCCVDILRRAINSSCGKVVTCDVANQTTAKLTIRSRWGSGLCIPPPRLGRATLKRKQSTTHHHPRSGLRAPLLITEALRATRSLSPSLSRPSHVHSCTRDPPIQAESHPTVRCLPSQSGSHPTVAAASPPIQATA